jgi:hypothetical protein
MATIVNYNQKLMAQIMSLKEAGIKIVDAYESAANICEK